MKFNNIEVNDVYFNTKEVMKIYLNTVLVYEKSSGDWQLSQDKFIIGEDGKYYQYLFISDGVPAKGSVDLNNEWVKDTISTEISDDYDYFMSDSNYHIGNSFSQFMVEWSGLTHVDIQYRSQAESSWDYLVINGLDKDKFTSIPSSSTPDILAHTQGVQTDTFNTLSLDCDENTHHIWFAYMKDGSADVEPDRAFVGIPKYITQGSIIEIDHKKGAELRYDYIKSSEYESIDETHVRFKYYKTYYTPNGEPHQTSDFVYGEIEELQPIDISQYCQFTALDNDVSLGYEVFGGLTKGNIYYNLTGFESTDVLWDGSPITIPTNQSIWIRNEGNGGVQTSSDYYKFNSNNEFIIDGGNISNLKNTDDIYTYYRMFQNTNIVSVNDECMPNEAVKDYGYHSMFQGCSALTTAPELPQTVMGRNCYVNMFRDCNSLVEAPSILPATTLTIYCYQYMFYNCGELTQAPALPATTLASYCYREMFANCYALTQAPELPATTLADNCYNGMLHDCWSLTQAPELPATTLADGCYNSMFQGCPLTQAPELPATTLAPNCYNGMFRSCPLTQAPELPATTLAPNCYQYMFQGCRALTQAPELPATELVDYCYFCMFQVCSNLNYIKANFTTTPTDGNYTTGWVTAVAPNGTFVKNPEATWDVVGDSGVPNGWVIYTNEEAVPLTFSLTELDEGVETASIKLNVHYTDNIFNESVVNKTFEYRKNNGTWQTYTTNQEIPMSNGDTLEMRGDNIACADTTKTIVWATYWQFETIGGKFACYGNVQSLVNNDKDKNTFYSLFEDTSITTAPILHGNIKPSCYREMFMNCKSLTKAPELPATELANGCYNSMFRGCSALTQAPSILPATELADGCYYGMFQSCTSLTTAPELPAIDTTSYESPYDDLFNGCRNLNYIKCMTKYLGGAFDNWVRNVSSTGTFVRNANAILVAYGVNGIPEGWTVEKI